MSEDKIFLLLTRTASQADARDRERERGREAEGLGFILFLAGGRRKSERVTGAFFQGVIIREL